MAAEGPDAVETLGRASPSPSSPPLPTSLAPDDDARARLLEEADALSETLRVVAEATDALPEGALAKNRVLAAKFRLRGAKQRMLDSCDTRSIPESVPSSDRDPEDDASSRRTPPRVENREKTTTTLITLFAAELRRSRAVADACEETVSFWVGLERDENTATRLLHAALCVALRGNEDIQFEGARALAARYADANGAVGESLSASRTRAAANAMIQCPELTEFRRGVRDWARRSVDTPGHLTRERRGEHGHELASRLRRRRSRRPRPDATERRRGGHRRRARADRGYDVCSFVSLKGIDVVRGAADDWTTERATKTELRDGATTERGKTKRREAFEKRKEERSIANARSV